MLTHPTEDGVAQELQRIEQEFSTQRALLAENSAQFAQWQNAWNDRQRGIDHSLAQLKARLQSSDQKQTGKGLNLFKCAPVE